MESFLDGSDLCRQRGNPYDYCNEPLQLVFSNFITLLVGP